MDSDYFSDFYDASLDYVIELSKRYNVLPEKKDGDYSFVGNMDSVFAATYRQGATNGAPRKKIGTGSSSAGSSSSAVASSSASHTRYTPFDNDSNDCTAYRQGATSGAPHNKIGTGSSSAGSSSSAVASSSASHTRYTPFDYDSDDDDDYDDDNNTMKDLLGAANRANRQGSSSSASHTRYTPFDNDSDDDNDYDDDNTMEDLLGAADRQGSGSRGVASSSSAPREDDGSFSHATKDDDVCFLNTLESLLASANGEREKNSAPQCTHGESDYVCSESFEEFHETRNFKDLSRSEFLKEYMECRKLTKMEETPSESLVESFVGTEIAHEDTDNLSSFFEENRSKLECYTKRFSWTYSLKWLVEIFNPYRYGKRARLNIFQQIFGVSEQIAAPALVDLNMLGIKEKIKEFLLPKSEMLAYRVGISKNVSARLKKHGAKLGIIQSKIMLTKLSCTEMHFLELCGIQILQKYEKENIIGKCLNDNPGYDNKNILESSGECSIYILTSLETFEHNKSYGKLDYINQPLEKRDANHFYDFVKGKNYDTNLKCLTPQLKFRYRKNYECSAANCKEAFKCEFGQQVHIYEVHIFSNATCKSCMYTGNLSSVLSHLNQKRECQGKNYKKITQVKTDSDRRHNMEVELWRLEHLIICDASKNDAYKKLKEKKRLEDEKYGGGSCQLDPEFMRERQHKHALGRYTMSARRKGTGNLNVLMHSNDFGRNIFWYHPNPWCLMLMRQYRDDLYYITGDFCSPADMKDMNQFVIASAKNANAICDHEQVRFVLPVAKTGCRLLRIFKSSIPIVTPKMEEGFPAYINFDKRIIPLRNRFPCGKFGPID